MTKLHPILIGLAIASLGTTGANASLFGGVPAPKVAIKTLQQLPTPLPVPYEALPAKDVHAQIDAAFQKAAAENKRVIIDMGGNWCSWCRILASVMDLPDVKPFIDQHFEVVSVDVSSTQTALPDRNPQVMSRFKVKPKVGLPYLVIADADGKIVHSSSDVTDDDHHTPQTMVNLLARFAK